MVKTLKMLKIAMKNSILTDKVKYESAHSKKCTIDLDSQDEDSEVSFSKDSDNSSKHSKQCDKEDPLTLNKISGKL